MRRRKKRLFVGKICLVIALIIGVIYIIEEKPYASRDVLANEVSEIELSLFSEKANQSLVETFSMPLLLQKDKRWNDLGYGHVEKESDLVTNGCAILSLAMVLSYWRGETIEPSEILSWSGEDYYVEGQGTSWQIFEDFAYAYGLNYYGLGTDFSLVKEHLSMGRPVIVSVTQGTFTTVGHIMVLAMNQSGEIVVFDPNDNPEKNHYQTTFADEIFRQEAISFWTYSN